MPFLVILKRFEVWLLLALVVGLLAFALQPTPAPPLAESDAGTPSLTPLLTTGQENPETEQETFALAVREVRVSPSSGGLIVETVLQGRAPDGTDLPLDESAARAVTDDGLSVTRFFEPFREEPVLLASGESEAILRWWLPTPTDTLWLEIGGIRVKADLP